jgi:hypothetical protein
MTEISGFVVIILRGAGVVSGEVVGERKTDAGDFLVLASAGDFTAQGEIIDSQVPVGKIESLLLWNNEEWGFSTNRLGSAYFIGVAESGLFDESPALDSASPWAKPTTANGADGPGPAPSVDERGLEEAGLDYVEETLVAGWDAASWSPVEVAKPVAAKGKRAPRTEKMA